jgi:molecular chaperone DnaK
MEKTLNDNREKAGAVASEVETAIEDAKKALQEGGLERLNDAFNALQTASHKLAEVLYAQTAAGGGDSETGGGEHGAAAGAGSSSSSGGDDNVIDAEYVDVEDKK